jgi:cellulose synthase operon protein C
MLASNSREGSLLLEDKMEMAQILAPRPEPMSRSKAVGLLEEINEIQPLNESATLMLGSLYFRLGEWSNCRRHMIRAVSRFSNSIALRQAFATWLLSRGNKNDYDEAAKQIARIRELAPDQPATFELVARHAIKTGDKATVATALIRRLPKENVDPKSISDTDAKMLALYGSLLTELQQYDHAERLYRLLVARDPKLVYDLASFLGLHRNIEQCFDLLDAQYSTENLPQIMRVSVAVVRKRRDEVGNKFDARIEAWLERGLQVNYGSVPLLLAKAEFRELQENYEEASAIYRELLANTDVTGLQRAVVLNNFSFLRALSQPDATGGELDPLALVEEAATILGPTSDILDTRGVILTLRKRYDEAIADLTFAVTDNPTPAKYFHKAAAHLQAGQNKLAVESWTKAEELGLTRDALNRLEHATYQQLQARVQQLRAGDASVTRAEPVRQ